MVEAVLPAKEVEANHVADQVPGISLTEGACHERMQPP